VLTAGKKRAEKSEKQLKTPLLWKKRKEKRKRKTRLVPPWFWPGGSPTRAVCSG